MAQYEALRDVAIGFGDEDPDRPWRQKVEFFEAGETVPRAEELKNLEALVVNGYLRRKEVARGTD